MKYGRSSGKDRCRDPFELQIAGYRHERILQQIDNVSYGPLAKPFLRRYHGPMHRPDETIIERIIFIPDTLTAMLSGIVIRPINRIEDERGFLAEILRDDWPDMITEAITQINLAVIYPGIIKAWHKHERGQIDFFFVIQGALKICIYDEKEQAMDEIVATGLTPKLIRVPGHYWHGYKTIGAEPVKLIYFLNRTYNYMNPDEVRRPWNDPTLIPKVINNKPQDPRCGKPWDWNYSPNA